MCERERMMFERVTEVVESGAYFTARLLQIVS